MTGKRLITYLSVALLTVMSGIGYPAMAESYPPTEGDLRGFVLLKERSPVPEQSFMNGEAKELRLGDFEGQVVLLNFWATWCAPCRKEMPTLSALQEEFGGDSFQVVTLATGRNSPAGIAKFFDEAGISNLPHYQDQKQALAREMGILGLPISVLIDPDGMEIARLIGDADWHSDSARDIIRTLTQGM